MYYTEECHHTLHFQGPVADDYTHDILFLLRDAEAYFQNTGTWMFPSDVRLPRLFDPHSFQSQLLYI